MIGLADKLSNMRDIDRDYPECGEELWNRFRMKDKHVIGWYYKSIRESLRDAMQETEAFREYCKLIDKNFSEERFEQHENIDKGIQYCDNRNADCCGRSVLFYASE